MAIIIQTQKTGIPVQIGELHFEIDLADGNLDKFTNQRDVLISKLDEIKGNDIKAAKNALKESFDFLLGDGAFNQIYEQTPSVLQCLDILTQLVESTADEFEKRYGSHDKKLQKYLKKKK